MPQKSLPSSRRAGRPVPQGRGSFLARPGSSAEFLPWPRAVLFLVRCRLPVAQPGMCLFSCTGFLDKRWPVLSSSLLSPVLSKKPDASPEAGRCHTPASSLSPPELFSISEQRNEFSLIGHLDANLLLPGLRQINLPRNWSQKEPAAFMNYSLCITHLPGWDQEEMGPKSDK